jgi:hypothetical protein
VRFTPAAIIAARIALPLGLIAAALWFVVRPLRRKVTDEQVALYLEEHEPALQATLLSAVESSRTGATPESEALVRKVVEQAIEACVRMDAARRADEAPLKKWAGGFAAVAVAAALIVMVGPAFLRNAASALLLVSKSIEAAVPYKLEVSPGDLEVAKGADQAVKATLSGFTSENVVLKTQRNTSSANAAWEEIPLIHNDDGSWDGMLFDVMAPLKYQVVANGVKSKEFTLTVVDRPLREEARPRIPLPVLHRPRGREGRGRRRHRGAERHRGQRAHHADDEDAWWTDQAERQAGRYR